MLFRAPPYFSTRMHSPDPSDIRRARPNLSTVVAFIQYDMRQQNTKRVREEKTKKSNG